MEQIAENAKTLSWFFYYHPPAIIAIHIYVILFQNALMLPASLRLYLRRNYIKHNTT